MQEYTKHTYKHEPTTPVYYNPYESIPLPPAPPVKKKRSFRWVIELVIMLALLCVSLFVTDLYANYEYTHGYHNGYQDGERAGYKYAGKNVTLIPAYVPRLDSTSFPIFLVAFDEALAAYDIASVEKHTDTAHFTLSCIALDGSKCRHSWNETKPLLASGSLQLDAQVTLPQGGCSSDASTSAIQAPGTDVNDTLPLAHYGNANFTFIKQTTYVWVSVYLC